MGANPTVNEAMTTVPTPYETPELVLIGDVSRVVLGFASGGYDGEFQISPPDFEFQQDGVV